MLKYVLIRLNPGAEGSDFHAQLLHQSHTSTSCCRLSASCPSECARTIKAFHKKQANTPALGITTRKEAASRHRTVRGRTHGGAAGRAQRSASSGRSLTPAVPNRCPGARRCGHYGSRVRPVPPRPALPCTAPEPRPRYLRLRPQNGAPAAPTAPRRSSFLFFFFLTGCFIVSFLAFG